MDGTLVVGHAEGGGYAPLPGAVAALAGLRAAAVPFVVFTNGTAQTPAWYAAQLTAAGIAIEPAQMMTPSSVAADCFLAARSRCVLVLGLPGVASPLSEAGIAVVHPGGARHDDIDAVYIGWHPAFGLADVTAAIDAVLAGATLYVSSDAAFFFTSKGPTLGVSRLIAAAVTSATGKRPRVLGKPSMQAARLAARRLGVRPAELAVVGDDPRLEIAMARRSGAIGIGVTTGLTDREAWAREPPQRAAHFVIDRLDELLGLDLLVPRGV
jgi:NagD protein